MSKKLSTVFSTLNVHTMAQIIENSKPSEDQTGDELLSSEEWMIIGDKESSDNISVDSSKENNNKDNNTGKNDDNDDDDDDDNDEESTAEVAREAIQVLGDQESDRNFEREESLMSETLIADTFPALKDDDSDGISVITESERNDDSICKCITEIVTTKDVIMTPRTCIHIVIACLLAVSIGFGIGWYVNLEKPQIPTTDVNFKPAKNGKLLNDMNKLNLDDSLVILNSNPELASVMSKHILNGIQKPIKNDKNFDENFLLGDIFNIINIFVDTFCSMIDNINFDSMGINYKCNYTAFNLMSLKKNIESIKILTKLTEENSNSRFQDKIKSKIDHVPVSIVNDLSSSIEFSVRKINRKVDEIKHKLHHKVCLMQNTKKNNLNNWEGMKQIEDLGIDCAFESEGKPHSELKTKGEKRKLKKLEKVYSHPIGPDVKQKVIHKYEKVESNIYSDNEQSNERMVRSQKENKGSRQYEKKKIDRKYNDKNSSEDSELKVSDYIDEDEEKSVQDVSRMKYNENQDDWKKYTKRDYENICDTISCMNQKNKDRKYSQERKNNNNWQFKRSEGRDKWRTEKKADVNNISWDNERSRARENARLKY